MLLRENITGKEAVYKTNVEIEITDKYFHVNYVSEHPSMYSYTDKYNGEIYNGDAVELFITANDVDKYYEFEIAPNNTKFVGKIDNDGNNVKLTLLKKCFIKSTSKLINNNWVVDLYVPLSRIGHKAGKTLKYNILRIDTDGGKTNAHLFALHPTMCGSFHKRDFLLAK